MANQRISCGGLIQLLGCAFCVVLFTLASGGCASAKVSPRMTAAQNLPQPDAIVVNDIAINMNEVTTDAGIGAGLVRSAQGISQSADEIRVGHLVADKLASSLVEYLNKMGIPAYRARDGYPVSATTLVINGQFIEVDEGNQTLRTWVGFGLGHTSMSVYVQGTQGGKVIAKAQVSARSGQKPGLVVSLGAGAAAESAVPVVVGAAAATGDELFLSTVEADARRTAKEIAIKIGQAYVKRGWISKEALDEVDTLF